jgi:Transcriptional regulatory protein, C terminal
MEQVWPKAVVSPETLSQRIKLLRDALGDDPRSPRYIEGLRGRGYRLIPSVDYGSATQQGFLAGRRIGRLRDCRVQAQAGKGKTGKTGKKAAGSNTVRNRRRVHGNLLRSHVDWVFAASPLPEGMPCEVVCRR